MRSCGSRRYSATSARSRSTDENSLLSWLEASGQAWKAKAAVASGACAFILLSGSALLATFTRYKEVPVIAMVLAVVAAGANIAFPLQIRCRVCALQIETSKAARALPRGQRLLWMESIEVCPVCGDSGEGTAASRAAWKLSGHPGEPKYWSRSRIGWAILICVLGVVSGVIVGSFLSRP